MAKCNECLCACCVIDEGFGRSICSLLKFKLTGTLGVIAEMKDLDILKSTDLQRIRRSIRKSGFYLSKDLFDRLDDIYGA